MSGIMDRVHVFKEGGFWWVESPTGRAFRIPGMVHMRTVQAEAMTLHDHPEAIEAVNAVWMRWCPICTRLKKRV